MNVRFIFRACVPVTSVDCESYLTLEARLVAALDEVDFLRAH